MNTVSNIYRKTGMQLIGLIGILCLTANVAAAINPIVHYDAANRNGTGSQTGDICNQPTSTWKNLAGSTGDLFLSGFPSPCTNVAGWDGSSTVSDGNPETSYQLKLDNQSIVMPAQPYSAYAIWFRSTDTHAGPQYIFHNNRFGNSSFAWIERGNLAVNYGASSRYHETGIGSQDWHHLVITNNGSTTIFYLDGIEFSREAGGPEVNGSSPEAHLASGSNGNSRLKGAIASFRGYNAGLSKDEVEALYSLERGRFYPSPTNGSPQIDRLSPALSNLGGGSSIKVFGDNLSSTSAVTIGGNNAGFSIIDDNELLVTTPAGTEGYADITVVTSLGQSTSTKALLYTATPTDNVVYWFDAGNINANGQKGFSSTNKAWVSLSGGDQGGLVDFAHPANAQRQSGWIGSGTKSDPYGLAFLPAVSGSASGEASSDHVGVSTKPVRSYAIWFSPRFQTHPRYLFSKTNSYTYFKASHNSLEVRYNGGTDYTIPLDGSGNYLLVATNDGSRTHFYLNGTKFAVDTTRGPETALGSNSQRLAHIGSLYGNSHFAGCIGEFRAYSDYLTPAEVQSLAEAESQNCGSQNFGLPQCSDGIDNDNDGVSDANDPGCFTNPNDPNTYDPNDDNEGDATTQCQDGIDNDNDNVIDANDPGCWTNPNDPSTYLPTDNDESNATTQCQDGIDNDNDGVADAQDPGCFTNPGDPSTYNPLDNDESNATTQCQDGIDNDNDGVADAQDPGCFTNPNDPSTYNPLDNDESNATTQCQDGIDNDNDGIADAQDPGCFTNPNDPSTYNPLDNDESNATMECQDGLDNDNDGLADANDPGCWTDPTDPTTYVPTDDEENNATSQCQDGIDNDNDGVADANDPGCYTDPTDPGTYNPLDNDESNATTQCQDGLDNDNDGLVDFPEDTGCSSPTDNDEHNPNGPSCDNGIDDDGDGKVDFQVGDAGDPGCLSAQDPSEDDGDAPLVSPVFTKFNTYLGQQNFAELAVQGNAQDANSGAKSMPVQLTIYNLIGEVMISRLVDVSHDSEFDIDVNALVVQACSENPAPCSYFTDLDNNGVVDTYGLVRLDFDDTDPKVRFLGRLSNYRPNPGKGNFSFAFARAFRNRTTGTSYGIANTYDPQGQGFLVPNWAELIYFGDSGSVGQGVAGTFTYNLYNQSGELVFSRDVTLEPLGEFDLQAGHEILDETTGKPVEGVWLAEVVPHSPSAEYFLSVARYSSNSPVAVEPETYNYAFAIPGRQGSGESQFSRISNEAFACGSVTDWVEVVNVLPEQTQFDLIYRNAAGAVINVPGSKGITISPKSQLHFPAGSVFLEKGAIGSVEVKSNKPGSILTQTMVYIHDCENNSLQTAYVSVGRGRARQNQFGTINTFLGMDNEIGVIGTSDDNAAARISLQIFGGEKRVSEVDISNMNTSSTSIIENSAFSTPTNSLGAFTFETPVMGQAIAEVYRIRRIVENGKERVDFYMPTIVR